MPGGKLASKVEVPKWCHDDGLIKQIADTIRAECIMCPGYPDITHRAHEYAAINFAETEMFRGMIDGFAAKYGIKIYKSAKVQNKQLYFLFNLYFLINLRALCGNLSQS